MEYCNFNKLSPNSRVGITPTTAKPPVKPGPHLPIFLKGSYETKTKTPFKPKIPKSGKNLYEGFYIRTMMGFDYIYDIESTIFVASIQHMDSREWIDQNQKTIKRKLNDYTG